MAPHSGESQSPVKSTGPVAATGEGVPAAPIRARGAVFVAAGATGVLVAPGVPPQPASATRSAAGTSKRDSERIRSLQGVKFGRTDRVNGHQPFLYIEYWR